LVNLEKLDLRNNNFSINVIENIREHFRNTNTQVQISIREFRINSSNQSTDNILKSFSKDNISFDNISNKNNLNLWLNRLSYIKEFSISGKTKNHLIENVVKYIQRANDNSDFRTMFELAIDEAATTCGDRMALSVLRLSVLYKLSVCNNEEEKENLLINGVYVLSLLEDIARAKVKTLKFVDEIEVYLVYPIKLKDRLKIPIDLSDMLYASISGVSESELNTAEEYVLSVIGNKENIDKFILDYIK